jgi:putative ABC transport system substrate-binding protein
MQRREFMTLLGGAAATWPLCVRAPEQEKVFRLALVATSTSVAEMIETGSNPNYVPLLRELRRLGYVEGKNLAVLRFSAEGDTARYDSIVCDVAAVTPDAVIVSGNRLVLGLKAVTSTIPVIAVVSDPIASGIVASLSRPGGNITGVTTDAGLEISGKRLATLLEVVPGASRVGFLVTDYMWQAAEGAVMRDAAERTSVSVVGSRLSGTVREAEYRRVFETMKQDQAQALFVSAAPENYAQRRLVVDLADKARLPAIYPLCRARGVDGLFGRNPRSFPTYGWLCRPYLKGGQSRRDADLSSHEIRARHQPQDCKGAWNRTAGDIARPRRRGDRMKRRDFIVGTALTLGLAQARAQAIPRTCDVTGERRNE